MGHLNVVCGGSSISCDQGFCKFGVSSLLKTGTRLIHWWWRGRAGASVRWPLLRNQQTRRRPQWLSNSRSFPAGNAQPGIRRLSSAFATGTKGANREATSGRNRPGEIVEIWPWRTLPCWLSLAGARLRWSPWPPPMKSYAKN